MYSKPSRSLTQSMGNLTQMSKSVLLTTDLVTTKNIGKNDMFIFILGYEIIQIFRLEYRTEEQSVSRVLLQIFRLVYGGAKCEQSSSSDFQNARANC